MPKLKFKVKKYNWMNERDWFYFIKKGIIFAKFKVIVLFCLERNIEVDFFEDFA